MAPRRRRGAAKPPESPTTDTVEPLATPVLAVEEEPQPEPVSGHPVVINSDGQIVDTPLAAREVSIFYTPELAERIYDMYVGGMSLHAISCEDGLPSYGSILRWFKEKAEFRELIENGRALRALHHEEEALRHAESAFDKDDVPAARLKFDAHVWAAEVNDPSRYGKKTTVQGDPNRPIVFQISTGVPERPDQTIIELNPDGTVKEKPAEVASG